MCSVYDKYCETKIETIITASASFKPNSQGVFFGSKVIEESYHDRLILKVFNARVALRRKGKRAGQGKARRKSYAHGRSEASPRAGKRKVLFFPFLNFTVSCNYAFKVLETT